MPDHDQGLTRCDGCSTPSPHLTDVDMYLFCSDCIEDMVERANDHRDYEASQL